MVPIEALLPGMRVKIVDQWSKICGQNSDGLMDKYLGRVVTVLSVYRTFVYIEEDSGDFPFDGGGHWAWGRHCFDYIVKDETQEDFEPLSNRDILSLIFGDSVK